MHIPVLLEAFILLKWLSVNMLNNVLSFAYELVLNYLCNHERRKIKQTYDSGESQIEVRQLPTEKTGGGKGCYA